MITDEVSVYNLALNAIGARNNVEITAEASREAEVCRLWYAAVRDQILAAARWPSARKFQRLAANSSAQDVWADGDPEPGFTNSFKAPSDMLRPQHLSSFGRFTLTASGSELIISCSEETPILAYTFRQTNIALWDSEMQLAVVYGLAAHICLPLNGKLQRAQSVLNQANAIVVNARVGAANTDDNPAQAMPDFLAARGGSNLAFQPFVYFNGPLLSVPSVG